MLLVANKLCLFLCKQINDRSMEWLMRWLYEESSDGRLEAVLMHLSRRRAASPHRQKRHSRVITTNTVRSFTGKLRLRYDTINCIYVCWKADVYQPNQPHGITRSSAIAEGRRDASCQLKSCQLPRNSAETTYTTSPDQINGMKLEI